MLPDVDLLLGIFGIQHRTLTHSVIFWSLFFVPVFLKYRRVAVPYFIAVVQHILFGDLVVGRTAILWPLADQRLGLGFSILSPINLALEAIGLALLFVLIIRNKDLSQEPRSLRIMVVVPLITFVILASLGDFLPSIFLEGSDARYLERNLPNLENPGLQVAVFLHLALIALVLSSFLKTDRKYPGVRQI